MNIPLLKSRIDIMDIAGQLGIAIGKADKALCPFHDDRTPSLQFSREKQIATCFSSNCHAGTMDVVALVQKKQGWTLPQALKWLSQQAGIYQAVQTPGKPKITEAERIELLTKLYQNFESAFIAGSTARRYIESRNINHKSLSVGYNTGTFHHSVNLTENREETIKKYVAFGLLKKTGSGYAVFGKGCLVFPLKNKQGQIVSFYYRETDEAKKTKHYYLRGRQGLYPNYPKPETSQLVLCESIIDAITLQQNTDVSILANYGTEGSKEQLNAILKLEQLEELILFFDGDEPGRRGAKKIAETIHQHRKDIAIKIVQTPDGEDVNTLIQGHEATILSHLIKQAKAYQAQTTFFLSAEKKAVEKSIERKKEVIQNPLHTSNPNKIIYTSETAVYYIKGGIRKDLDSLKVTLVIEHPDTRQKSRNKLDLYEDKQTEKIAREAGEKLNLRTDLLLNDLHILTDLLDDYREQLQSEKEQAKIKIHTLTSSEKTAYSRFGKQRDLMQKINDLIGKAGIVGEEKSRLFLFCGAVSHRMYKPLNIVVQGGSGSGKSYLIKVISYLVPQEKVKRYTRLSEKSFYNFGEFDLCNTLIIIEDYDGMNEEVEYAFRELQSNGELISAVSGKEFENAAIQTKDKIVRGPIASMVATTKGEVYHDNSTRVFFIAIDESSEQTERIIDYKNRKANGEIIEAREENAKHYLQGFVRTLKSYKVKNPYLKQIRLPVPHDQLRRLHELLEAFSNQITLLHQHQRKTTASGELIAEKQDMEIAIDLLFDSIILKVDELDGRLRQFYEKLKDYVKQKSKAYEFIQREIRQALKLSKTGMQRYMRDLEELEYIGRTGKGRHGATKYKIIYWDDNVALRAKLKSDLEEQLKSL